MKSAIYIFSDKKTEFLRLDCYYAAIGYEEKLMPSNKPGKEYAALSGTIQIPNTEYCFWCWHTVTKNGSYTIRVFITTKPFKPTLLDGPELGANL